MINVLVLEGRIFKNDRYKYKAILVDDVCDYLGTEYESDNTIDAVNSLLSKLYEFGLYYIDVLHTKPRRSTKDKEEVYDFEIIIENPLKVIFMLFLYLKYNIDNLSIKPIKGNR